MINPMNAYPGKVTELKAAAATANAGNSTNPAPMDHQHPLPAGAVIWTTAPASGSATGTAGQIAYDATNLYICVAANTWKTVALEAIDNGGTPE